MQAREGFLDKVLNPAAYHKILGKDVFTDLAHNWFTVFGSCEMLVLLLSVCLPFSLSLSLYLYQWMNKQIDKVAPIARVAPCSPRGTSFTRHKILRYIILLMPPCGLIHQPYCHKELAFFPHLCTVLVPQFWIVICLFFFLLLVLVASLLTRKAMLLPFGFIS